MRGVPVTTKPIKYACGAAIAASFFLANHAAQHAWPLWTITLAGAIFVGAVVAYLLTAQTQ